MSVPIKYDFDGRYRSIIIEILRSTTCFSAGSACTSILGLRDYSNYTMKMTGESKNGVDTFNRIQAVKVECSEDAQRDPEKLKQFYDSMEDRFLEEGLNLGAIEAQSLYFNVSREKGGKNQQRRVQPLSYTQFVPVPLPPKAVRLCVAFMDDPSLSDDIYKAACDIFDRGLPPDHFYHESRQSHYHTTLFMTSRPDDMRPDPWSIDACMQHVGPSVDVIAKEIQMMKDIVGTVSQQIILEVYKILLADSGTLLLCLLDTSDRIHGIRKAFRESFPGAPSKQSTIYHMSLGRIVTPKQFSPEQRQHIQSLCSTWSERLRGRRCLLEELHHVIEEQFTTVEGERTALPLGLPKPQ